MTEGTSTERARPATRYTIRNHNGVYDHVGDAPTGWGTESTVSLICTVTRANGGSDHYIAIPDSSGRAEDPYTFEPDGMGGLVVLLKNDGTTVRRYSANGWLEFEVWLQSWDDREK